MRLLEEGEEILSQLKIMLTSINADDYSRETEVLGGSTIGQHIRHTLEFFICLLHNDSSDLVDYNARQRDIDIQTNAVKAIALIDQITGLLQIHSNDRPLKLVVNYSFDADDYSIIDSNYFRELSYNIEHAIHHMAMIKIALREVAPYVILPNNFGIAPSTIRYQIEGK